MSNGTQSAVLMAMARQATLHGGRAARVQACYTAIGAAFDASDEAVGDRRHAPGEAVLDRVPNTHCFFLYWCLNLLESSQQFSQLEIFYCISQRIHEVCLLPPE